MSTDDDRTRPQSSAGALSPAEARWLVSLIETYADPQDSEVDEGLRQSAWRKLSLLAAPVASETTDSAPFAVFASDPRPSSVTYVDGAVDVAVLVTLPDGREIRGDVTLAPGQHDSRLAPFGSDPFNWSADPSNWISSGLLRALYAASEADWRWFRSACDAIQAAALEVAP